MYRNFLLLLVLSLSLASYAQQTFNRYDSLRGTLTPLRAAFDVHYYDLTLSVDIQDRSIAGSNNIYFKVVAPTQEIQLELFNNLIIDSVCYRMHAIPFERDSNSFFIHFPVVLQEGSSDHVQVYYHGHPIIAKKAPWDGGWVFTKDSLERPWVGVACEGIGASLWWPVKDHLSDEPDSMSMTYIVPDNLMAVGNGNLASVQIADATWMRMQPDGLTTAPSAYKAKAYTWKVNYPINSYNVTCNIGTYSLIHDEHIQLNKDTLEIDYYVLDYNSIKAEAHFKQVHPMLTCYEHYFGPYPFPKDGFSMVETPYWGMEHQSAIAYGNNYTNQIIIFDYIIIHESGHEWWGNNVSTADHAELWIHESFTTYTENLLVEYYYGYDMSVRYLNLHKSRIKNTDPIVGPKDVNYNNWQGSDMYYKGAWILHSFRNTLRQDSLWFSILKGIQTEYALQTINTDSIIQYINRRTGSDYTWFFVQYLYQAEPPVLEYYTEKEKKKIFIYYRWKNVRTDFKMPVYFYLYSGEKTTLIPTNSFQRIEYNRKKIKEELFDLNSFYYLPKQIKK